MVPVPHQWLHAFKSPDNLSQKNKGMCLSATTTSTNSLVIQLVSFNFQSCSVTINDATSVNFNITTPTCTECELVYLIQIDTYKSSVTLFGGSTRFRLAMINIQAFFNRIYNVLILAMIKQQVFTEVTRKVQGLLQRTTSFY